MELNKIACKKYSKETETRMKSFYDSLNGEYRRIDAGIKLSSQILSVPYHIQSKICKPQSIDVLDLWKRIYAPKKAEVRI